MNKTVSDPNKPDLSRSSILIIDDNPTNLGVAAQYLEERGFKVLLAQDGESGLERASYAQPDLILLDVLLPGINGFEVCRNLKADEQTRDIPVIFMTALSEVEDKVKGFQAGGVDYITKPLERSELLARITTHLRLQALTQQLREQNQQLRQAMEVAETAYRELQRIASLDGLTQVANRRCFDEYLVREWRRSAREQTSLSLILFDIDYFKRYNDYYGHQAGDDCLKQIAQAVQQTIKRPADFMARYGGEEFVVVLPRTSAEAAVYVAELIQHTVQNLKLTHAHSDVSTYVTLSLGVSHRIADLASDAATLITEADQALYIAKNQGRDRYHLFHSNLA